MKNITNNITTISIDAEWVKDTFLTVQMACSDEKGRIEKYYIFCDNEEYLVQCPKEFKGVNVEKVFYPIGYMGILDYFESLPKQLDCLFFYSPRDIESFLGPEVWSSLLLGGKVVKRRNLNISPYYLEDKECTLRFVDLYGRFSCSLEKAYNLMGIDTSRGKDYISTLNIDKSRMDLFMKEYPLEFFEYSLSDLGLHELSIKLLNLISELLDECFSIEDLYESIRDYPGTIGRLVSDVFLKFISIQYPDLLRSSCLLSITPNDRKSNRLNSLINSLISGQDPYLISKRIEKCGDVIHGLGMCSIPAFFSGHYGLNDTSPYGAIVQGGRAIKEDSENTIYKHILDIDLQSAYGTSLKKFDYPIGIPSIYSNSNHSSKRITLKQFLNQYSSELIDGLYVIAVSGRLKYHQDLIFSKYGLSSHKIGSKILGNLYEEDDGINGRLGGKFLLTSKEIRLGFITSHMLEIIRNMSSNQEYRDWMDLKVDVAIYYPKSHEMSIDKWADYHSDISNIGELSPHNDNRSRYWCRFPLNKFIDNIIEKRLYYKAKRNESPIFDAKQSLLKLFINTLYGDLASPYFLFGNTVVSNNITSSVRAGSWIMSKALGTKLTVTDGGTYTPYSVPFFRNHLKSFYRPSLSKLYKKNSRWGLSVEYKSLIDESIESILRKENAQELLDNLALEHINRFCSLYNISFPFKVEHKLENSGSLMVTNPYGKVDYIIYTYYNTEVIKIRGVESYNYDNHPKVEFLRALAQNRSTKFSANQLIHIVGINEYIKGVYKKMPGHEVMIEYIYKPNSNGGSIYEDYLSYLKAEEAHKKRIKRYESKWKGLELNIIPPFN